MAVVEVLPPLVSALTGLIAGSCAVRLYFAHREKRQMTGMMVVLLGAVKAAQHDKLSMQTEQAMVDLVACMVMRYPPTGPTGAKLEMKAEDE